jgi:hypothetical protein
MTVAAKVTLFPPKLNPDVTSQGPVMPQKAWSAKRER